MTTNELLITIVIVAVASVLILRDAMQSRRARSDHADDAARLDALQRYQLGVVPGKPVVILQQMDGTTTLRRVGIGGETLREAIDSAILEMEPPNRRAGDPQVPPARPPEVK